MTEFEGILLSSNKYKNNDLICNILTNNGLISCLNRGGLKANSKLNMNQYILFRGKFDCYSGGQKNLMLRSFSPIFSLFTSLESFEKMSCLNFIQELTLKTIYDEMNFKNLYSKLSHLLEILETKETFFYEILNYFYFILKEHGIINDYFESSLVFSMNEMNFKNFDNESNDYVDISSEILCILKFIKEDRYVDIKKSEFKEVLMYFGFILNKQLNVKLNSIELFDIL